MTPLLAYDGLKSGVRKIGAEPMEGGKGWWDQIVEALKIVEYPQYHPQ
jgi:hypothetical protein